MSMKKIFVCFIIVLLMAFPVSAGEVSLNKWVLNVTIDDDGIVEETIQGALNTKLVKSKKDIVDTFYHFEEYGYPTPSIDRDNDSNWIKKLEKFDVYSRGRFGAWKYEVGNMDHSLMQGVEVVNRLLRNEEEITVFDPMKINKK